MAGFPPPGTLTGPVSVTIGNFDGVHLGHQRLLRETAADAALRGCRPLMVTFHPHPRCVLDPPKCPPRLTELDERAMLARELGVEAVFALPFTLELSRMEPAQFCDELIRAWNVRCILEGPGFALGHQRKGDLEFLRSYGKSAGFVVREIKPVVRGDRVSSGRVRDALAAGNVGEARTLLGRDYTLSGTVVEGDRRGRTLGFPTANLAVPEGRCVPGPGVYATWLRVGDQVLPAATSIGFRPTFEGAGLTIEAYALDFDGDLYGRSVNLDFVRRLRPERKFDGADALVEQMHRDVAKVRRALSRKPA